MAESACKVYEKPNRVIVIECPKVTLEIETQHIAVKGIRVIQAKK